MGGTIMNNSKYRPFKPIQMPDRKWPNRQLTAAPIWCSVDLRDGNQALEAPMTLEQKLAYFQYLVEIGFKEIEVSFPAASDTEFNFTRTLIERDLIPDDVTIQVLTQARRHIIERTFEALEGVPRAVVHLYNSTSTLQRDVVFHKDMDAIKGLAVEGAEIVRDCAEKYGRERFIFEYSPESFTGTEMNYAAEVCNAVLDVWEPGPDNKVIINLPDTVQMSMPNVYADQIEYMCEHLRYRSHIIVSLHAHNDRGTGVAATELALLAGADRVEGTLFGNGERTGNADLVTLAMNLYSHGIDPGLDFSDVNGLIAFYEEATGLPVHPRHPYAGDLVFTAFSGSHQDAINKGMAAMRANHPHRWEVPYLPIDPADLGRSYDPIIRINSQSGKGGVAYVLEQGFSIHLPKDMQQDCGNLVTQVSDEKKRELKPDEIYQLFMDHYVNVESPVALVSYHEKGNGETVVSSVIAVNGEEKQIVGSGDGLIEGFCNAIQKHMGVSFEVAGYSQHALGYGTKSRAITYVSIKDNGGRVFYGAGLSSSISKSSIKAIISAINRIQ